MEDKLNSSEIGKTFSENPDRERVRGIIREVINADGQEYAGDQFYDEAGFSNNFGLDSLDTTELLMEVERAENVEIPDDIQYKIREIGELIDAVLAVEKNK